MTLHKLSAGSGYTYLTDQVAAHDATERSQAGLAEYYTERGESPGRWLGSGLPNLGLAVADEVTEEQMVALFGRGHHPREAELGVVPLPLGRAFPSYTASSLRQETAAAFSAYNRGQGNASRAPIPADVRARIRTDTATKRFVVQQGRAPADDRELAGFLATESRTRATPVAAYDLTFSPVKSVSALWALAPRVIGEQIVAAHDAAVADVIGWLEREVAFTRLGQAGIRQVPVTGLVATAFTHRDSRAGDPDLHTHVAVSNKVQTTPEHGSRWLALDGRVLFKAKVAASERYNTRLEAELIDRLGLKFTDRTTAAGKRPVREVDGMPTYLMLLWSKRRRQVEHRQGRLAAEFQATHGRPPTTVESAALAQRANLETRDPKHEPRNEDEQHATWRREADDLEVDVDALLRQVSSQSASPAVADLDAVGTRVIAALEASRATWQVWHVRAETQRQARAAGVPLAQLEEVVEQVVTHVLDNRSVSVETPDTVVEPPALRRPDGESVYTVHGAQRYTSRRILDAEGVVLAGARRTDGRRVDPVRVGIVLAEAAANGRPLDPSQSTLVTDLVTSGARVQVAIAPAGTGKTTTMRALAEAWRDSGGHVLGLAPSAVAARELAAALRGPTDTLAKLTTDLTNHLTNHLTTGPPVGLPDWLASVGSATLAVVDEAGMAATTDLAALVSFVTDRGGSVRLVGDDQQFASVAAGGLLRDLARERGSSSLSVVHRFSDPAEAAASLAIRAGDPTSLGYYTDHARVHVGDPATAADQAYLAWVGDSRLGLDSLLLAPTRGLVIQLNERARLDRLAGDTADPAANLTDGTQASAGDVIVTRHNDRRLVVSDTDWVKNGDRWRITSVHPDGSLRAVALTSSRRAVRLPADYVAQHVQLGYATTVHAAQGMTVDTCHTVVDGAESRQLLYVALSRGRQQNHVYLGTSDMAEIPQEAPPPLDVLRAMLGHDDAEESATTARRSSAAPGGRLHDAADRYDDALVVAAEALHGAGALERLDAELEQIVPGLTSEAAYPTLRGRLAVFALDDHDPITLVRDARNYAPLDTARDLAAVLGYRLVPQSPGPLPWLPAVPHRIADDPEWGTYLHGCDALIRELADQVALSAAATSQLPDWARGLSPRLRGEVAVWRAALAVPDTDQRPTGQTRRGGPSGYQQLLDQRIRFASVRAPEDRTDWATHLPVLVTRDAGATALAARLRQLQQSADVPALIEVALAAPRPLPIENPADALWWRILGAQAMQRQGPKQPVRETVSPHSVRPLRPHEHHSLMTPRGHPHAPSR